MMPKRAGRPSRGHLDNTRIGPIGRLARLGWAVVAALTLASIVDRRGSARFRNPHILTEPSAWFLHGLMLVIFVLTVGAISSALVGDRGARRLQRVSIAAIAGLVVIAGIIGEATSRAVWGFPLADLTWYFDVVVLEELVYAFVLATIMGTPGCEINVWPELISRVRSETAGTETLACIVGLNLIDRWEAQRRRRPT